MCRIAGQLSTNNIQPNSQEVLAALAHYRLGCTFTVVFTFA